MSAPPLSLHKVLSHYLNPQQVRRYLKTGGKSQVFPARHHYNSALRDLSIRDSEGAIYHLVAALELEPRYEAALHLARTMLFGLNKLFHEEGGELYQMKYPSLGIWRQKLERELQEREFESQRIRNEVALHQPKRIWKIFDRWFGRWRREKIAKLEERLKAIPPEVKALQKQRALAIKLSQIQEYAKVLSLIMEACLFPARYAWVGSGASEQEYEEQIWYG